MEGFEESQLNYTTSFEKKQGIIKKKGRKKRHPNDIISNFSANSFNIVLQNTGHSDFLPCTSRGKIICRTCSSKFDCFTDREARHT